MTLKALLFDFDGTLVESEFAHYQVWKTILAGYGHHFDADEFSRDFVGLPIVGTVDTLLARFEMPVTQQQLIDQKLSETVRIFQKAPPILMPHVEKTLEWAKSKGFRLALVTGSSRAEVMPVFDYYHLDRYFEYVVTRTDVKHSKPDPECYLKAMKALHIDADEALALEDTAVGAQSARNAKLDVIAIPHEHTRNHDFSHVTYVAESLEDARSWIEEERLK